MTIFKFKDYNKFFKNWLHQLPGQGRGVRAQIAKKARMQTSYLTQVINNKANLTIDQAISVAEFMNLSSNEQDYFLLLVNFKRAGSPTARKFFSKKISTFQDRMLNLSKQLDTTKPPPDLNQFQYFGHWLYPAVHLLIIQRGMSPEKVADALNLPLAQVENCLHFLLESKVVSKNSSGRFESGSMQMHLDRESPYIVNFHNSFRAKAIEKIAFNDEKNVHYSSLVSISEDDFQVLKSKIIDFLDSFKKKVRDSDAENIAFFNLDFFQ